VKPDAAQAAVVSGMAREACLEMFASFAKTIALVEDAQAAPAGVHDIASFIGFTGPVRGSLMVSGSRELFRTSYPVRSGKEVGVAEIFDWAGEIANQLLGRIKRRFCAVGVDFRASTPTAIGGVAIGLHRPGREGACELMLAVGPHCVAVCLEVTSIADDRMFKEAAAPIDCTSEGDMVVF
jgi:chemotaxis protein CheX